MNASIKKGLLIAFLFVIYGIIFYFLSGAHLKVDFNSFYSSALAYIHNDNPYSVLHAPYFSNPGKVAFNLNPPFFLEIIRPFTWINYSTALIVFSELSFILGLIGAVIVYRILSLNKFLRSNNGFDFVVFYLLSYATLINLATGQLGAILFFFIMAGYGLYLKKRDYLAGFLWGIIIALKFFPALLILFIGHEKRFKVLFSLLITFTTASLIPLFTKGTLIYLQYFHMLHRVRWYGDNWNASLLGFIFRLFFQINEQTVFFINSIYMLFFIGFIIFFFHKLSQIKINPLWEHQAFSLTLILMVFLSPFGWMYYFSLLSLPVVLLINSWHRPLLLASCLFLMNLPLKYVRFIAMSGFFSKLTIHSTYFFGLLILLYLFSSANIKNIYPPLYSFKRIYLLLILVPILSLFYLIFT